MNAVKKVNIAGLLFQIDEKAIVVLDNYLVRLHQYYDGKECGSEVMESIEERIADLLFEKIKGREIVGERDVMEVIEVLGAPELSDSKFDSGSFEPSKEATSSRRLFRDPEHRVLGGLFSGISCFIGIKRNVFRILFLLFSFYFALLFQDWTHLQLPAFGLFLLLLYVVFCFVVPMAKTWEDRMAMNGLAADLSSIGEERDSHSSMNSKFNQRGFSEPACHSIWVSMMRFMGLIFTLISIVMIISLIFFFFFPDFFYLNFSWINFLRMIGMEHVDWIVWIGFIGFFALFTSFLYSGIKAMFQLKSKWRIGWVLFFVFVGSMISLSFLCVPYAMQFSASRTLIQEHSLLSLSSNTLYLEQEMPLHFSGKVFEHSDRLFFDARKAEAVIFPCVNIYTKSDSLMHGSVYYKSSNFYNGIGVLGESTSDTVPSYELIGNRLIIKGKEISVQKPWDRADHVLDILLPKGCQVVKVGAFSLNVDVYNFDPYEGDPYRSGDHSVIVL